jgi:hypothetical protein
MGLDGMAVVASAGYDPQKNVGRKSSTWWCLRPVVKCDAAHVEPPSAGGAVPGTAGARTMGSMSSRVGSLGRSHGGAEPALIYDAPVAYSKRRSPASGLGVMCRMGVSCKVRT